MQPQAPLELLGARSGAYGRFEARRQIYPPRSPEHETPSDPG